VDGTTLSPVERSNLRIAYIVGSFPHVSETFIANQIVGMAARGHQVDIYMTVPPTADDAGWGALPFQLTRRVHSLFGSANPVVRALKVLGLLLGHGWRMPRVVLRALNVKRYGRKAASLGLLHAALTIGRRARAYDVVHCQFGTYGDVALRLMEIGAVRGKLVTSFRGFDATRHLRSYPRAYEELFRKGDLFLPVSRTLAERLVQAGCAPGKIVVHHSGIEFARFRMLERHRDPNQPVSVLSIARLSEKKGIEYAIRAVAKVAASGRKVVYRVAGEGPLRAELQRLIGELDVNGQVELLGWRSHEEVLRLLEQAHVLFAPSVTAADGDEEGIPNSAKEAMAQGLPVIGTCHGGIPELIEDGVSGFLVPQRDADALADRLVQVIDHPEIWAQMGRAGRNRIKAEYDIHRLNGELESLYQRLLNGEGAVAATEAGTAHAGVA
jgi:colanic acid/amylovoran biosynthesis glycosyltransferase